MPSFLARVSFNLQSFWVEEENIASWLKKKKKAGCQKAKVEGKGGLCGVRGGQAGESHCRGLGCLRAPSLGREVRSSVVSPLWDSGLWFWEEGLTRMKGAVGCLLPVWQWWGE